MTGVLSAIRRMVWEGMQLGRVSLYVRQGLMPMGNMMVRQGLMPSCAPSHTSAGPDLHCLIISSSTAILLQLIVDSVHVYDHGQARI
jgi:hypothetical protein